MKPTIGDATMGMTTFSHRPLHSTSACRPNQMPHRVAPDQAAEQCVR
jgi:hypothetical protein